MTVRLGNEAVSVVRVDSRFAVAAMDQLQQIEGRDGRHSATIDQGAFRRDP